MRISRRELLAGAAAVPFLRAEQRPKIAAVANTFFPYSHAQHIVDRLLEGYGWNGTWHHPPMDLVSLYVDQVGANDLSRDRARRFPSMRIYPSIAAALTLGGGNLAVDGVVLVGEHGNYPKNEKGQTRYPRYEFFQQIVSVFRASGHAVPVFNDKHLSWNWDWAKQMYGDSQTMGFPLMAGSSLPVTWRIPSVEMPLGAVIREALCVCYGGVDSYDFHGLETIQCMVERRKGGESGVLWIEAYRGERFWQAYREGVWPRELVEAALCRSHTLTPSRPGFRNDFPSFDDMRRLVKDPVAYRYQHRDGTLCTMMLMNGLLQDFNFAARIEGRAEPFSTEMYLPMPPARTSLASFFSPLVHHIEEMFLTGKPSYPVERTLLTTGLTAAGVESLFRNQTRYETPHLAVSYEPDRTARFGGADVTQRLAVVTSVYGYLADRFLIGYPREGRWHKPDMKVVSLYVDQKPEGDLSGQRAAEFGFRVYPTVAETLRCGGDKLAVDAVLMAGDFSKPCVEVLEADGRAIPVYHDMHPSSFEKAKWMVESARRLNFPLLAGSSLPVTWRLPDIELPLGCEIEDALTVGAGKSDYQALEAMQAMIERRRNGETGVKAAQMIEGSEVWKAGDDGRWSKQLLTAALSRSDTPQGLTLNDGRTQDLIASGELPRLVRKPAAYFVEHRDGLRTTLLMLDGAIKDFTFAARLKGGGIESTQFLLTPEPNATYSACLAGKIEEMFVTGQAPYPAERALITVGVLDGCLNSRLQGFRRLETPHLGVKYQPPPNSQHCRS